MASKTKRIVNIIATVVPSGLVLLSGIVKFMGGEQVVQGFTALGVIQYLPVLGMAEVCFALLFIPRKTMKLGFILSHATLREQWQPSSPTA
jgi:hypothetical protein